MASKAQRAIEGLIARGFSPVQAAVLAGNIQQESGFNPEAYNPKEDAYGGIQWRLDRKANLEKYAKDTGRKASDPEAQMDFLVMEMTGQYGNEAKNAAEFLAAQDPATANRALKKYIRYGDNSEATRLSHAMSYINGGNALTGEPVQVADASFVNPSFGGAEMPGVPEWNGSNYALPPGDAPAPTQSAPPATAPTVSDDDLLNSFLTDSVAAAGTSAPGAVAGATSGSDDDALLQQFMPAAGETASPAPAEPEGERNSINRLLFGGDRAPENLLELIIGTGEKNKELGGYAGNVAARVKANEETGYVPSSVPWLDPVSTYANAAVDALPVVGAPLTTMTQNLDAATASALEGKPVTAQDRAAINKAQAAQFPEIDAAGRITGAVAPFLALGATGVGSKLLGITGANPVVRAAAGGGSNALIAGADTLMRGGSLEDAKNNALLAGAFGAGVPAAFSAAGKAGNALLGKTSPEVAELAELAMKKYNIPIGPGQISESPMVKVADSVVNKLPFTGGTVSNAQQTAAFNRAVSKTLGENATSLTPDVMGKAADRIGSMFDDAAAQTKRIASDPAFDQKVLDVMTNAQMSLTEQQMKPLMQQFDNIIGKFQQGNGSITGDVYQELTKKGAPLWNAMKSADPGIRDTAIALRNVLDDAFERSASPEVVKQLRTARAQWKAMKTIEDLVEKSPTGDINPALLMGAVRKSYGDMAYGGGGELADLARIGQQFLKAPPSSGTAERLAVMNMLTKVGGAGGLAATAAMNPGSIPMMAAIGAPAAVGYLAAAKGAGALLRSQGLANRLIGNSLGRPGNPNAVNAGNLLLRGATGASGLGALPSL